MGRGLDGFIITLRSCAVFKLHRALRLAKFRWRIARGKHLFPFRTEQLSLSAPMVLGGQPPGRVGRRRFFLVAVRALIWRGLRRPSSGALRPRQKARVALLRHASCRDRIACFWNASLPRQIRARTAEAGFLKQGARGVAADRGAPGRSAGRRRSVCATLARPPSGL